MLNGGVLQLIYADRPVERASIDRLLAMSSTAPMGFPPSSVGVVVINGKDRVQELAKDLTVAFRKWLFLGTPVGSVVLRLMMDKPSVEMMRTFVLPVAKVIIDARKENRDLLFYDAPCVILFHYPMKDTVDPTIAMILGYPAVKFCNGIRRRFKSVEYV